MPNIQITAIGLDDVLRAIGFDFQALGAEVARRVAEDAALPRLREYPPASGRPQPFTSAKARRFFFAALRSGAISVPYRRTGELGRRWAAITSGSGALVYNSASHAELVQGEGQADYFRGTWQDVTTVAAAVEAQEAATVGEAAVVDFFRKAGI